MKTIIVMEIRRNSSSVRRLAVHVVGVVDTPEDVEREKRKGQVNESSCKSFSAAQTSVESSRVERFRLVTRRSIATIVHLPSLPYCCANVRRWGAFLAKTIVFPIGFQWCRFL